MAAPFLRTTGTWMLPVALTATKFDVPAGFFQQGGDGANISSVWILNPNLFWVRVAPSGSYDTGSYVPVTDWNGANPGYLFPPGFYGAFATLFPKYISTIAVTEQGIVPTILATSRLEFTYGGGA